MFFFKQKKQMRLVGRNKWQPYCLSSKINVIAWIAIAWMETWIMKVVILTLDLFGNWKVWIKDWRAEFIHGQAVTCNIHLLPLDHLTSNLSLRSLPIINTYLFSHSMHSAIPESTHASLFTACIAFACTTSNTLLSLHQCKLILYDLQIHL